MAKVPSDSDEIFALNTQGYSYTLIWKANISSESEDIFAIRGYFCHQRAFCFYSSDKCTGTEITMFLPSDLNIKLFYSVVPALVHLHFNLVSSVLALFQTGWLRFCEMMTELEPSF